MIGVYCRVSTEGQVDGTSLDTQEQAGRLFAGSQSHKIYRDEGFSGGNFQRPKFEELVADISKGIVDQLWVLDFDRLSRARPKDLDSFFIFLEDHHVKLFVNGIYQPLDDPEQMLSPYLMGLLSYIEKSKIRKRSKRGKIRTKDEGKGTFSQAYGYRQVLVNGVKKWEIVENEATIIKEIFQLYLEGKSQRQIEFMMKGKKAPLRTGQWNRTVISRILTRLFYAGKTTNNNGDIIDAVRIPSIVSWEDYQRAQEIAASRNCKIADRRVGTKPILYSCSAIVKCGSCGKSWIHKRKPNAEYYSCQHDPKCEEKRSYIQRDVFETIIYYDVTKLLMSYKEIEKILKEQIQFVEESQDQNRKIIESLNTNLIKLNNKKQRLIDAIAEGVISNEEAKTRITQIGKEQEETNKQIDEIVARMKKEVEDAELMLAQFSESSIDEFNALLVNEKENEINKFLRKYIKSAILRNSCLEIEFITGKKVSRWVPRKI